VGALFPLGGPNEARRDRQRLPHHLRGPDDHQCSRARRRAPARELHRLVARPAAAPV